MRDPAALLAKNGILLAYGVELRLYQPKAVGKNHPFPDDPNVGNSIGQK